MPMQKHHRSIIVWVESVDMLETVVNAFDQTVLWCSQFKELGIYHKKSKIYFFSSLDRYIWFCTQK